MSNADDVAAIRAVVEAWANALREKNIDGIMACCAEDMLAFDCHSQFRLRGADAYRQHLQTCFPYMQGPLTFEVREFDVVADGDVAFCYYVARCVATGFDEKEHTSWLRTTNCLRRANGRWLVTHAHCSAPFNPMTGMAMLDGQPATGPG